MQKYSVLYCDYWKQILVLLLFPLVLIFPMVIVLISIKNLSDVMLLIITFAYMGLIILAMIYIVFKQVYTYSQLTISATGLEIAPQKRTLFNPYHAFHIGFDNIKGIASDQDVNHNNRQFYTITLNRPSKKVILMAPKKSSPEELKKLDVELFDAINTYNTLHVGEGKKIATTSFYAGKFAKGLTYSIIFILAAVTIMKIVAPDFVAWYKLIGLYALSFGWLSNYYAANKKLKGRSPADKRAPNP